MKKLYVEVTTRLIINMDEDGDLDDVISEMEYDFISQSDCADIVDMEIRDYEVKDVK